MSSGVGCAFSVIMLTIIDAWKPVTASSLIKLRTTSGATGDGRVGRMSKRIPLQIKPEISPHEHFQGTHSNLSRRISQLLLANFISAGVSVDKGHDVSGGAGAQELRALQDVKRN